jgi:hypothetical protein
MSKEVNDARKRKIAKKLLGIKRSEEFKEKVSVAQRGEKGYQWKGGRSSFVWLLRSCYFYKRWRREVYSRDQYTCQKCRQAGGDLEAHHIVSFAQLLTKYNVTSFDVGLRCKELWDVANGITYCAKCHAEEDVFRGRTYGQI